MRVLLPIAALAACALLSGCGNGGDQGEAEHAAAPEKPAVSDAEKLARVASLPAPYNTADLENGKRKFGLCRSCHTLSEDGPKMTGPHLDELFGRKAGSHDEHHFQYSDALKASGITWDAPTLDKWIESPRTLVPGTKMSFAGLKDPKARIDLIGYLKAEAGDAD